ncbi:hypothetical protein EVU96_09130 [Bacillus infantis]|uniref:hypothetical protein n=1 Tax=Bacillus infantis TaxID=324767 RepID=UPI00101C90B6|nr:hypothetical protein [Bacillus infantis]RYI30568.1 hypothetical protein EVU96_09130 [Bacillus infantis]
MVKSILGNNPDPYALISSLMIASAKERSKLTEEEKAERKERRRLLEEQRVRKALVLKSICPDCEGKLIRGKKDKKNDYKRSWDCSNCGLSHNL